MSENAPTDAPGSQEDLSHETNLNPEELKAIIDRSGVYFNGVMEMGGEIGKSGRPSRLAPNMQPTYGGFQRLGTFEKADGSLLNRQNDRQELANLLGQGVSELYTTHVFDAGRLDNVLSGAAKGDELPAILEMELTADAEYELPFDHPGQANRGKFRYFNAGGKMRIGVLMAKSDLDTIMQAAETHPDVLRQTMDAAMLEGLDAGAAWAGSTASARPPYEAWEERDGASRIAIKEQGQAPKVIEFHQPSATAHKG